MTLPIENLLTHLLRDSHQTDLLLQSAVILTSGILSFFITHIFASWVRRHYPLISNPKRIIHNLGLPLLWWLALALAREVLRGHYELHLLNISIPLLITLLLIRAFVFMLRHFSNNSAMLRLWERSMVWLVWLVFGLHITGLLPLLTHLLDSIAFTSGDHRFSLLLLLEAVGVVTVAIIIALWLSQLLETRLMQMEGIDPSLRLALIKFVRSALLLIGVIVALPAVGIDITVLSVFGGALGVGLGLGLQKIASNYVSGFIILLDRSIRPGDMITVDGQYGEVRQLNTRYTLLRALDGTEVILPNETLITSVVINHSFTQREVRIEIPVQISYDSNLELARTLIRDIAREHVRILKDDEHLVDVNVTSFGDNGINLTLRAWIKDPELGKSNLTSDLYLAMLQAFNTHQIDLPYPRRDIRILRTRTATEPPDVVE